MREKVINLRNDATAPVTGLRKLVEAFKNWNTRRLAKAELRAMPNYLLNDIGIRRELIDQYVDGALPRRVASVVELDCKAGVTRANGEAKAA